jgi:hypothetical protein
MLHLLKKDQIPYMFLQRTWSVGNVLLENVANKDILAIWLVKMDAFKSAKQHLIFHLLSYLFINIVKQFGQLKVWWLSPKILLYNH